MKTMEIAIISRRGWYHWVFPKGFTLIEMLLVVVIFGILAAITIPSAVESMQGNRLRSAARTIIMSGRYARSMALLKQRDMAIKFDVQGNQISIHPVRIDFRPDEKAETHQGFSEEVLFSGKDKKAKNTKISDAFETREFLRRLDRVSIKSLVLENVEDEEVTQPNSVLYFSNGTCTPYSIRLLDESGKSMNIVVDALSSVETERL